MDVVHDSGPLRVASIVWQPRPGAYSFTVLCKATFALRPTECVLVPEQDALVHRDSYWGDDPSRSLRAASDFCAVKARADVVLVGHAYAPGRQPVQSLVARLSVGEIDKAIEVYGDRAFGPDGAPQPAGWFTQMALVYERAAAGGQNPAGMRGEPRGGVIPLPNLLRPGARVASPGDAIEPIGFGPIAPTWPARLERLGRYAASWSPDGWHRTPLPEDLDRAYFNVAPRDQQPQAISESERIVLENLHPMEPRLVTRLPGLQPGAQLEPRGGPARPLQMRCDTLTIDTERGVCTLVWRGHVPIGHPDEQGRVVVTLGKAPAAAPAVAPQAKNPSGTLDVADILNRPGGPALPFAQGAPPVRREEPPAWPAAGLPFQQGAPPPAPPVQPSAPPPVEDVRAATVHSATPPVAAPRPEAPSAPPVENSPWASGGRRLFEAAPVASVGVAAVAAATLTSGEPAVRPSPPAVARPVVTASPVATGPQAASNPVDETLHLVWYDPESVPRIRRKAEWKTILRDLGKKPLDPDLDDPALAKDPMEIEDRREVFEILVNAEATDAAGVNRVLVGAVREDRKFVPGLVLTTGELSIAFDELETLKAAVTTVSPLMGSDENLKAAVEAANTFLGSPALLSAPAVAEGLTTRVRDAFGQGKRALPAGYFDAQVERALLEGRHYKRTGVFGDVFLRGSLLIAGAGQGIPTYLPEGVAKKLPLYRRFAARVIAEVHLQVDQYETHAAALKVVGVVRAAAPPKG
jgi:hypothetical protein